MRMRSGSMKRASRVLRVAPLALTLLATNLAHGQNNSPVTLQVTAADRAAPVVPKTLPFSGTGVGAVNSTSHAAGKGSALFNTDSDQQGRSFYPGDVNNPGPHKGPTLPSARNHPIYINQPPSHWGDVAAFLTDLGDSHFIHLLDQYVGDQGDNRYTLGTQFLVTVPVPADNTFRDADIQAIVHAAAAVSGSGYGDIYHLFFPSGVDVSTVSDGCYSPDNQAAWTFCSSHNPVTFNDAVGHVLYTVEPYEDVRGCWAPADNSSGATPNGQLADSTDNWLSHEIFETITDPDIDAWYVHGSDLGNEIGDYCLRRKVWPDGFRHTDYGNITLNDHWYSIQPEYSNQFHGCAY